LNRQPNSRNCFVCGIANPIGLRLRFTDDGEHTAHAEFVVPEDYNGYPGVVHGGIVAAILDEVAGRAMLARGAEELRNLFVTMKLDVRYRRPTPTGTPLTAIGWMVQEGEGRARVRGEIRLPDGTVTAEAECLMARPPAEFVERWEAERPHWKVYD
jgi:uncharacterized protein (TIGR00369 family)